MVSFHIQKSVFKMNNNRRARSEAQTEHQQPHGRPASSDAGEGFEKLLDGISAFNTILTDNKTASTSTLAPYFSASVSEILLHPCKALGGQVVPEAELLLRPLGAFPRHTQPLLSQVFASFLLSFSPFPSSSPQASQSPHKLWGDQRLSDISK